MDMAMTESSLFAGLQLNSKARAIKHPKLHKTIQKVLRKFTMFLEYALKDSKTGG